MYGFVLIVYARIHLLKVVLCAYLLLEIFVHLCEALKNVVPEWRDTDKKRQKRKFYCFRFDPVELTADNRVQPIGDAELTQFCALLNTAPCYSVELVKPS